MNFVSKCKIESGPIDPTIIQRVANLLGPGYDSLHLGYAIQERYDIFLTTDFRTILDYKSVVQNLEDLILVIHGYQRKLWPQGEWEPVVKKLGIKTRSPLQFLEENLLPLPTLIRTLYGSWTDPGEFIIQTGQSLFNLLKSS